MGLSSEGRQRSYSSAGDRMVVIATPLEDELVEAIRAVDDRLEVLYQPDLLPPPSFPGDHRGLELFRRTKEQDRRWRAMLARAEVLFGLPGDSGAGLADAVATCPRLRWVQATAAGAGEQVRAAGLSDKDLDRVSITSASGVHVGPLAEFALFGWPRSPRSRLRAGGGGRR